MLLFTAVCCAIRRDACGRVAEKVATARQGDELIVSNTAAAVLFQPDKPLVPVQHESRREHVQLLGRVFSILRNDDRS